MRWFPPQISAGEQGSTCSSSDAPNVDADAEAIAGLDSVTAATERLRAFRNDREWERFHTPKNLAIAVMVESGELLEHFQWREGADLDEHVADNSNAIADELADVVICAFQLADVLGLSLPLALESKIEANSRRYPASVARGSAEKHPKLRSVA